MNLLEVMGALIKAGKNEQEIAQVIMSKKYQDADIDFEGKTFNVQELAQEITKVRDTQELQQELKRINDEKKEELAKSTASKKEDAKFDAKFAEKLKSVKFNPFNQYPTQKKLNRFNHRTKKFEEINTPSEVYGAMNNFFKALIDGDKASAKAISNQIDIDNIIKRNESRGIKVTPTVSDVAGQGGYAIPTEVDNEIYQLIYDKSAMLSVANTDNIIMEDKLYPVMYGITVVDIADQSTAATEAVATFTNPTVNMERAGAFSIISNTILMQKGADLVNAFTAAYSSSFAEFVDLRFACGNVTNTGDLVDGICFDTSSYTPTAIALTALSVSAIKDIKNYLSAKANAEKTIFIANRKVSDTIGLLENTGGAYSFPGWLEGKQIRPFGIPLIVNPQIPSVLDIGGDARTGGTDDVLICADMSGIATGISPTTRIETSKDYLFTTDQMVIRGIKRYGQKVLSATGTAGIVAVVQELTN